MMKKILTFLCAIAFTGAALLAQNSTDTIKVIKKNAESIVIVIQDEASTHQQHANDVKVTPKASPAAFWINVGYNCGYRANVELLWANKSVWGITSSHGFSFGNGLYVGGGAGFGAELTKNPTATASTSNWNASYFVPVFADIKYSFSQSLCTPFVCFQGGAIADITHQGIRTFANPAIGLDIARFSVKAGYEYQLGFWGNREGEHTHQIKLGIAYTF